MIGVALSATISTTHAELNAIDATLQKENDLYNLKDLVFANI